LGDLGATYDDHLRLIGKRVVDFLLVLIEFFSLGVTADAIRANTGSKSAISHQRGPVDQKLQLEEGVAPTKHSFSQKTRLNDLAYGVIFFCFVTIHALDRQTDRLTDGPTDSLFATRPPCIQCSAVALINTSVFVFLHLKRLFHFKDKLILLMIISVIPRCVFNLS